MRLRNASRASRPGSPAVAVCPAGWFQRSRSRRPPSAQAWDPTRNHLPHWAIIPTAVKARTSDRIDRKTAYTSTGSHAGRVPLPGEPAPPKWKTTGRIRHRLAGRTVNGTAYATNRAHRGTPGHTGDRVWAAAQAARTRDFGGIEFGRVRRPCDVIVMARSLCAGKGGSHHAAGWFRSLAGVTRHGQQLRTNGACADDHRRHLLPARDLASIFRVPDVLACAGS